MLLLNSRNFKLSIIYLINLFKDSQYVNELN